MLYRLENDIIEISDKLLLPNYYEESINLLGKYKLYTLPAHVDITPDFRILPGKSLFLKNNILYIPNNYPIQNDSFFKCFMFIVHLLINLKKNHIVLHASAVEVQDTLVIFLGEKESGKTTMGLLFNNAGYPIVTNDFLEIEVSNEEIKVLKTDIDNPISFRLHSAYQLGVNNLIDSNDSRNEIFKISINKQKSKKVYKDLLLCFPHLINTENELEICTLNKKNKMIKLFQQLSYYYRNTRILELENDNLGKNMLPDKILISPETHQHIIYIMNILLKYKIVEFYGKPEKAMDYLINRLEKTNDSR